ncbi:MAG: hypothetical protein KIT18_03760 [Burkholderiales bacterium]|nr:hypothetical protein [Burkholderiales bacterium]
MLLRRGMNSINSGKHTMSRLNLMLKLLATGLFGLVAPTAYAVNFHTGQTIITELRNPSSENIKYIMVTGYITAVFDSSESLRQTTEYQIKNLPGSVDREKFLGLANQMHGCPPPNVTIAQLTAIVEKWLSENPKRWHENGTRLVNNALKDSFPCNYK